MNINNIELPIQVLEQLYGKTLSAAIGTEEKKVSPPMATSNKTGTTAGKEDIKALGNNRKNILILTRNPEIVFLSDEELSFLAGILLACKLSLDDVAVINVYHYPETSYKPLLEQFKSRIVLLFDIEPSSIGLPVSFPCYQLQAFAGSTFLYAPSLLKLENDKLEKSKLWVCLKRLFNL